MKLASPSKIEIEVSNGEPEKEKTEFEKLFGWPCCPKEAMEILIKADVIRKDAELMKGVADLASGLKKPIKSLAQLRKVRDEKMEG